MAEEKDNFIILGYITVHILEEHSKPFLQCNFCKSFERGFQILY